MSFSRSILNYIHQIFTYSEYVFVGEIEVRLIINSFQFIISIIIDEVELSDVHWDTSQKEKFAEQVKQLARFN